MKTISHGYKNQTHEYERDRKHTNKYIEYLYENAHTKAKRRTFYFKNIRLIDLIELQKGKTVVTQSSQL